MACPERFEVKLRQDHQIHKERTILMDAMMFSGVQSITVQSPPEKSQTGDKYIIPSNPKGKWSDRENYIAVKLEDRWVFIKPKDGAMFWIVDDKSLITFSKGNWQRVSSNAR